MGLGVIMVLLNTAVLNGHSSILSITSFPKNDIRDLRSMSTSEATMIAKEVNADGAIVDKSLGFKNLYDEFVNETVPLYTVHGALVNITYEPKVESVMLGNGNTILKIAKVNLTIAYSNSDTIYKENISVGT